jgi:hypothetical protein
LSYISGVITEGVTSFVILVQVLDKCQLREAVQEKEQGLDSHGRKLHFIYTLVSGVHFGQNRKLCSSYLRNSNRCENTSATKYAKLLVVLAL